MLRLLSRSSMVLTLACALLAGALATSPVAAEKRHAFVVGIDRYDNLGPQQQLKRAGADARAMTAALRELKFAVVDGADMSREAFFVAWQRFLAGIAPGDTAAVFFAGHGIEIARANYLIPRDAPTAAKGELVLKRGAIAVAELLDELDERKPATTLFILDACRNNPFSVSGRALGGTRGLAAVPERPGTLILYSAGIGQVALDHVPGEPAAVNSVFTHTLLPLLRTPGASLLDVAVQTQRRVDALARKESHTQTPAFYSQLLADVYLAGRPVAGEPEPGRKAADAELARREAAIKQREDVLRRAEREREAEEQRKRLAAATPSPTPPVPAVPPPPAAMTMPPVTPKPGPPPKVSPDYEERDGVGLLGMEIEPTFRAPSPIACRQACEQNAACVGYQHGRKSPMMGQCELFSRIDDRREDPQWRSGVRRTARSGALPPSPTLPAAPGPGIRVALVIGNSAYMHAPRLLNPENDARAIADKLKSLGFLVTARFNLDRKRLADELKAFGDAARRSDWALLYFAGHGMQSDKRNFLLPVDARVKAEEHLSHEAITDDIMLTEVRGAKKLALVVLDACRDNPFRNTMVPRAGATRSFSAGLARRDPGPGAMIVFSAAEGNVAQDGTGPLSPFAESLVQHLATPQMEVEFLFRTVGDEVRRRTNDEQRPMVYHALPAQRFYFNPKAP